MLKLIYFEGCPNTEKARRLLIELEISFEKVKQDNLPFGDPLNGYASPTVLDGENIIFGSKTGNSSGGCSLDIPSADQLRSRLGIK